MMYKILSNIFIFFLFVSSSNSINQKKTKFCINCKHFVNDSLSGNTEFGKCSLFLIKNSVFLVDGKNTNYYSYASTVRGSESLCGIEGKYYKKKYKKKIVNEDDNKDEMMPVKYVN